MFRRVLLSIIRRFFTGNTATLYVIQVCWHHASRIRTEILHANCQENCMTYTIIVCTVKISWF